MGKQDINMLDVARRAGQAYLELLGCTEEDKNKALRSVAKRLKDREQDILKANQEDLALAGKMVEEGSLSHSLRSRLEFSAKKLSAVIEGVLQVEKLPDPTGRNLWSIELDDGLVLRRVSCALGVIGVIFESRPDVVIQVSSLLLKAGNAGILKGGKEANRTNKILMDTIQEGLKDAGTVPLDSLQLLSSREEVKGLLDCDGYVDLLIPRGGNELVRFISRNTSIPVLGHTDGICHVYIHEAADIEKALRVTVDSKTDYPAVCNAAETILVDRAVAPGILPELVSRLSEKGVEVRGCTESKKIVPGILEASVDDWSAEYLDLIVSVKVVDDLKAAVAHINHYGSHHTDAIITEDEKASSYFCCYVDSSSVFVNASTRFADGFRYGFGAEIGISTNKIHARGPVGLEGIVTYKYELRGNGHVVGDYGPGKKSYKHRVL